MLLLDHTPEEIAPRDVFSQAPPPTCSFDGMVQPKEPKS